jgi:hypothetical protein
MRCKKKREMISQKPKIRTKIIRTTRTYQKSEENTQWD